MPGPVIVGSFDPVSWRQLQRDLKDLGPGVKKELDDEIKTIAGHILSDAKARAGWSSRIPGSLAVSVTTTRVGVKASKRKAPHARAFEGVRRAGFGSSPSFRHPVYGNRGVWVTQTTRPFMAPAIRENQADFFEKAEVAITNAARTAGWTR